ncbi:peptidase inhibitor 16, partial [Biomphalaria glabrata]
METKTFAVSLLALYLVCLVSGGEETLQPSRSIYRRPGQFRLSSSSQKTSFTEEEQSKLLNLHNAYRSLVFPQAMDMREL